jgi:hypothetical protein
MEHVKKPWLFADNLSALTRPGGRLYISVPWVWRYHPYPDDYFRFSWKGVMELFPSFEWSGIEYSTSVPDEFVSIENGGERRDDEMACFRRVKLFSKEKRKYLPYLMVNMIGTKMHKPDAPLALGVQGP